MKVFFIRNYLRLSLNMPFKKNKKFSLRTKQSTIILIKIAVILEGKNTMLAKNVN